jgi:hypothetical protein
MTTLLAVGHAIEVLAEPGRSVERGHGRRRRVPRIHLNESETVD